MEGRMRRPRDLAVEIDRGAQLATSNQINIPCSLQFPLVTPDGVITSEEFCPLGVNPLEDLLLEVQSFKLVDFHVCIHKIDLWVRWQLKAIVLDLVLWTVDLGKGDVVLSLVLLRDILQFV